MSKRAFEKIMAGIEDAAAYLEGRPNGCVVHPVREGAPDRAAGILPRVIERHPDVVEETVKSGTG